MYLPKEEIEHIINVLQDVKHALLEKNSLKLKELSNTTIHTASTNQNSASITIAVIVYALSKIIERQDYDRVKNWDRFVKKFNAELDLAIKALSDSNIPKYEEYIEQARKIIQTNSVLLKQYIQDVVKKASINKGSKIYEHGISLEQTAKLLGITQWELSDYIGSKDLANHRQTQTLDIKKRAKMALEFFS